VHLSIVLANESRNQTNQKPKTILVLLFRLGMKLKKLTFCNQFLYWIIRRNWLKLFSVDDDESDRCSVFSRVSVQYKEVTLQNERETNSPKKML
jgi:hypothetical protein